MTATDRQPIVALAQTLVGATPTRPTYRPTAGQRLARHVLELDAALTEAEARALAAEAESERRRVAEGEAMLVLEGVEYRFGELKARYDRLREAVRPFVAWADVLDAMGGVGEIIYAFHAPAGVCTFRKEDIITLAAALSETERNE